MAESFHNIIDRGTFTVTHRGEDVTLDLPEWLQEAKNCTEKEDCLRNWAEENEILLPLMQHGLKSLIIDLRSAARPAVNAKTDESPSIIADKDNAQKRLDEYTFKPINRPGTGKGDPKQNAVKAIEKMKQAGMSAEDIRAILGL